jgi:DNA polymerase-3 subunit gamma/tau
MQGADKEKDPAMAFVGVKLEMHVVIEAIKRISKDYAAAGKKQLALSLVAYPLNIVDDNIIEIPVENSIQQDEIRTRRSEILNLLRDRENLKCGDIRCSIVPAESVKHTAYTPSEKFEKMNAVNPLLGVMKQKLDLDVDF